MMKHSYIIEFWKGQGNQQRRVDEYDDAEVVVVRTPGRHYPITRIFKIPEERSDFETYTAALNSAEEWAVSNFKLELRTMLGAR